MLVSFNFLDYIPASPDYVLASPGKTYSSSSHNSFALVPIASPTLSLFHDYPYMKVMHAYYAEKSPIPPPTIMPPYSIPSPIKGLVIIQQDFDNLEAELRESHTQIAKLQRKQMGNNNKIALARFRIANLEQIISRMPPKRASTSELPAMTQAAIKKLVADSISQLWKHKPLT
ncbi:hypothetical protein Tco_0282822 [Tanacetum coccineum]